MGFLAQILLALGAHALFESGLALEIEAPLAVLGLAFVPYALAWLSDRVALRGRFRVASWIYAAVQWSPPVLHIAAVTLLGWPWTLERWLGRESTFLAWPEPSLLLLVLPFVVFELAAIDARARTTIASTERRAWRRFQWRMFASGLLPITVFVLVSSAIALHAPLRVGIEEVGLYHAAFAACLLIGLGLCLPMLLKNTWETAPIPAGPERDLLLSVAGLAGFARPNLCVWNTGHQIANAAIVGITQKSRVVLFSDLLLAQLAPRELAAVFAHEIGHAVRGHLLIFVVWVLGCFLSADLLAARWFPNDDLAAGALFMGTIAAWWVSFGFLSRRFELEADLYSLELLNDGRALISALERVGGSFRDLASWRHFSTADRVRFLERVQSDPSVGKRLRRNLRCAAIFGFLVFGVALVFEARRLAEQLPHDRVRVALRLGEYGRLHELAQSVEPRDDQLGRWIATARALPHDGVGAHELTRQVIAALDARDDRSARLWLELAALRGDRDSERWLSTPAKADERTPRQEQRRVELLRRRPEFARIP